MNASTPAVSVVIPAYNHEAYVGEAIASVLAQQVELELIIVDDGSTDRSGEVIAGFDDPRIRAVRQPNAGSHAALNRGIAMARGRYVAILNSDDRYHPGRLGRLLALAGERAGERLGDPLFAVTAIRLIDALGQAVSDPAHPWLTMYRQILAAWNRSPRPDEALFWGNFAVSTSNFFVERGLLDRLGPFRPYRYVLDWDYALRAAVRAPNAFVFLEHDPLLDYRWHGGNTIATGARRNHVEASRMLRRAIALKHGSALARPLARVHLLERFLRREERDDRLRAENRLAHQHGLELAAFAAERDQLLRERHARIVDLGELLARRTAQLAQRDAELAQRNAELAQRNAELAQRNAELAQRSAELAQREASAREEAARHQHERAALALALAQAEHTVRAMQASSSWRVTRPLRDLMAASRRWPVAYRALRAARAAAGRGLRGLRRLASAPSPSSAVLAGPPSGAEPAVALGSDAARPVSRLATLEYLRWLDAEAALHTPGIGTPATWTEGAPRPRFSIIVPLYRTDPAMLSAMLDSVYAQRWSDWELCLCDDASGSLAMDRALAVRTSARLAEPDGGWQPGKVRIVRHAANTGIVGASNDALALARGDWIVLLDHDDLLAPDALLAMAEAIAASPDARVLYSDEDKLDESGLRCLPFFKPDFSPALLWVQNYIGHLLVMQASLVHELGGFTPGFDGSQDYDLALRATEAAGPGAVVHVPRVLYHWRMHAASTASNSDAKPYAHEAGRRAVQAHLQRRYPEHALGVDDGEHLFTYRPRFALPQRCLVSIIIPTRDKADLLEACVSSILSLSTWPHFEVLVLDNNSTEPATFTWFDDIQARDARVRVIPAPIPFNWSRLNNLGVREARGDVFVFLNNDTVVITPDWLEQLAQWALLPDVGTVGAQLRYEDGTLQHAGVVVGMGGWADHVYKAMPAEHMPSPFVSSVLTRNVLASTGACVAVARERFASLGGFDESFEICGSDVELGIRAHRRGLQNVLLGTARLHHLESKTRSAHVPDNDFVQSDLKYAPYRLAGDPFYNPNLSRMHCAPTPLHPGRGLGQGAGGEAAALAGPQGHAVAAPAPSPMPLREAPAPDTTVPELTPMIGRRSPAARARLNLLLPSLQPEHVFGGISTALQFFLALAGNDQDARIILTDQSAIPASLPATLAGWRVVGSDDEGAETAGGRLVVPFGDRAQATLAVRERDVFVATGWWTAYTAQRLRDWQGGAGGVDAAPPLIYLIQDFEPGFYPWSSRHALAASTYRLAGRTLAVFNTRLLREHAASQGCAFHRQWSFEPSLNPALAAHLAALGADDAVFAKQRRLLVYGRPGTPRNAFELVCQGLAHWARIDPTAGRWRIESLGEPHGDVVLPEGCRLVSRGKLALADYAQALSQAGIGLSLMISPHPSYPPLEMAEFGVRTLTNQYAGKDLGARSPAITSLPDPTPEAIGEALQALAAPWRDRAVVEVRRVGPSLFTPAGETWRFVTEVRAEAGLPPVGGG